MHKLAAPLSVLCVTRYISGRHYYEVLSLIALIVVTNALTSASLHVSVVQIQSSSVLAECRTVVRSTFHALSRHI